MRVSKHMLVNAFNRYNVAAMGMGVDTVGWSLIMGSEPQGQSYRVLGDNRSTLHPLGVETGGHIGFTRAEAFANLSAMARVLEGLKNANV